MDHLTKPQLLERYEKLNPKLKDAIFSMETADKIDLLCKEFLITEEEKVGVFSTYIGRILLGFNSLEGLPGILESELGLEKRQAIKLAQKTKDIIFSSLIELLNKNQTESRPQEKRAETKPISNQKERPKKEDFYRELIE